MNGPRLINRLYSTPIGIYNFKPIHRGNYIKKLPCKKTSSYTNMYNALKSKIKQHAKSKKD